MLRISKLYQIPNFDEETAFILVEWLLDEYQCDPIEVVIDCLSHPPHTGEKNWRLTPDTLRNWMTISLEKEAERKENRHEEAKSRFREIEMQPISDATQKLIDSYLNRLQAKSSPLLIERKPYTTPPLKQIAAHELHMQYIRENYDTLTGKPLSGWMPENEWLKK